MMFRIQDGDSELRFESVGDGTFRRLEWVGQEPVKMTAALPTQVVAELVQVISEKITEERKRVERELKRQREEQ